MHGKKEKSASPAERKYFDTPLSGLVWPLLTLVIFSCAHASVAAGQQLGPGSLGQNMKEPNELGQSVQESNGDLTRMDPALAKRQFLLLNVQRQKTMVSDADKLLKLATELKAEIDAGDSASLSPEQLRKISEIEKLARSVKQKMSITVGVGPQLHDTFFP